MVEHQSHLSSRTAWVALMDVVCLVIAITVGVLVRLGPEEMGEYVFRHMDGWLVLVGSIIMANYLAGAYRLHYTFSRFNLVVTWLFSMMFALLVLGITSYAWFEILLGRGVLLITVVLYSIFSLGLKILVYRSLFRSDVFLCRTAILGTTSVAKDARTILENRWILPAHKVVAFLDIGNVNACNNSLDDGVDGESKLLDHVAVIKATVDTFADIVKSLGVVLVVLALDDKQKEMQLYQSLRRLRFEGVEVMRPLSLAELYSGKTPLALLDEESLMEIGMESELPLVSRFKRVFDIVFSLVMFVLLSPLFILVVILVKATAPMDPVFYFQNRVGQFGSVFKIFKIRTMKVDAEKKIGAVWAEDNDPRITRLGSVLRKFRIDEIPQLLNILNGDMSFVGPRPERVEMVVELEKKIPYYSERANVLPGLTGWAQIRYPYGNTVQDAAAKLEYDLYYIKHMSLSLDLQIILRTIRTVVFGHEKE